MFACYGGDQTFFITRTLFTAIGGYDESKIIMEDYDMTERAKSAGRYIVLPKETKVSARKYEKNSWLKVQQANYTAVKLYKKGASSAEIADNYKSMLHF
jgi:GT2 family glycosyltransferase